MEKEPKEDECGEAWFYAQSKWERALYYIKWKWWVLRARLNLRKNTEDYVKALKAIAKYLKGL